MNISSVPVSYSASQPSFGSFVRRGGIQYASHDDMVEGEKRLAVASIRIALEEAFEGESAKGKYDGDDFQPTYAYHYLTRDQYDKDRVEAGTEERLVTGYRAKRAGGFFDAPIGRKPVIGRERVGWYEPVTVYRDRNWLAGKLLRQGLRSLYWQRLKSRDFESPIYLVIRTEQSYHMAYGLADKFRKALDQPGGENLPYTKDDIFAPHGMSSVVLRISKPFGLGDALLGP